MNVKLFRLNFTAYFTVIFLVCFSFVHGQEKPQTKKIKNAEKKYQSGSYKTSNRIVLKTLSKINPDTNQLDYVQLLCIKANNLSALYKFAEADSTIAIASSFLEKIPQTNVLEKAKGTYLLSMANLNAGRFKKSLDLAKKANDLANTLGKEFDKEKNENLIHLSRAYFGSGYNNEALYLVDKYDGHKEEQLYHEHFTKKELKVIKNDYAKALDLKAQILLKKGSYNSLDSALIKNGKWLKQNVGKRNYTYRDHLVLMAKSAKLKGEFAKAIKYFEAANKYTKFKPQELTGQEVQEELIKIYYAKNLKHDAIVQRIKFERKAKYIYGRSSLPYARYKLQEVDQLYVDSKYDKADRRINSIYKNNAFFPANAETRQNILDYKIKVLTRKSEFDVATDSLQKLVQIKKSLYGESAPEYHKALLRLSEYYTNYSNNFNAAKAINENSFTKIVAPQLSKQSKEYMLYNQQMAVLYELTEKYDLAIKYLEDAGSMIKAYYGTENADYASDLQKMSAVLLKKGDFTKAEELIKLAVAIFKNTSSDKKGSLDKSETYLTLAKLYTTLGQYEEAENALAKASKLSKKSRKSNSFASAKSSDELADLYIKQGRYNEAETLLKESLGMKEKKLGKENRELLPTLSSLGNLYLITGNYAESEKNIRRALTITEKIFGAKSARYAESLRLLQALFSNLGDFDKAEETAKLVLDILQSQLGKNHIDVASALTQLAQIQIYSTGKTQGPEKLLKEALSIVKFNLGDKNPLYADQLKQMAFLYIESGRYQQADSVLDKSNAIYVEKLGKNNLNTAEVAYLKGKVAFQQDNYKLAQQKFLDSRNIYKNVFSDKHPGYVKSTSKLARAYYMSGEYAKARKMIDESTGNYLEFTKKYFPSLSFSEKSKFWGQIKDDFEFYNSLAFKLIGQDNAITGKVYDNLMATKALLLSSTIKVKQRILNSKDEKLISKFNNWMAKKQSLISAISLSKEAQEQAGLDPQKIEKEIYTLEKELSESSELFAQTYEKEGFNWKSLRSTLKPDEYAVEIMRFRHFNKTFTDSIVYGALIVSNKTAKSPELVIFPEAKKMETRYFKYYKNVVINKSDEDNYSYNAFWAPIKAKIPDNATIYVSSEGVFNEINIESLKGADGTYPIDKNLIVTVSNTKDILTKSKETSANPTEKVAFSNSKAVLFGNPTFYASAKTKSKSTAVSEDRAIAKADFYNSASQNVIAQLPGTEIEVNEINALFNSKGWKITKLLGEVADEDSIKNMKNPRILHIATHGYFNPDAVHDDNLSESESEFAANPLLRSGLLLKGAGDVLKSNSSIKINSDNGVLTAYEAMDLNLDQTDLVVLSACETGKGEVQIGEGVFGLQRSILVAGANTLVMTLFKVNDDITKELMIAFYKQWLNTGQLRASFNDAKKMIKAKYKYPVYWGSFVMVGLEK